MINLIEERDTLKNKLSECQKKLEALTDAINNTKSETTMFKINYGEDYRRNEEGLAELDALNAKESSLQAQYDAEKANFDNLTDELKNSVIEFTQTDLRAAYISIDTTKKQINALAAALDQAKQKSESTPDIIDTVTPLKAELQACLVSAALGVDVEKDISRMEKAITKAEASDSAVNEATLTTSKRLADTITGIESRLNDERLALSNFEIYEAMIKHGLMIDVAKELSKEYAEHAQQAVTTLLRLMALDRIIASVSGVNPMRNSGELSQAEWSLALPKTKSIESKLKMRGDGGHYVNVERWMIDLDDITKEVKNELQAKGMRL